MIIYALGVIIIQLITQNIFLECPSVKPLWVEIEKDINMYMGKKKLKIRNKGNNSWSKSYTNFNKHRIDSTKSCNCSGKIIHF